MTNSFVAWPVSCPEGYEIVTRAAPIRLTPEPHVHDVTNHAALGIKSVSVNAAGFLVVQQDWAPGEMVLFAKAETDLQLAAKGVTAGCSGGGPVTQIGIYRPSTTVVGRTTRIRADDPEFFDDLDNLWYLNISLRPLGTTTPPA